MSKVSGALRAIALLSIFLWAVLSLKVLILCPLLDIGEVLEPPGFWADTKIWAILTFIVIVYVVSVVVSRSQSENNASAHHPGHHALLSLLGGFAIALPALAVTVLAFATAFPHFLQALKGSAVDPDKSEAILRSSDTKFRSAYVLGIDVSHSVISDSRGEKMTQIQDLIALLFSRDSDRILDSMIDSGDAYWSYAFAGEQHPLAQKGQAFQDIRVAAFPAAFDRAIKEHLTAPVSGREKTDILSFLESIVTNVKTSETKRAHTTVLIFSDFRQDAGSSSFAEVKGRVQAIMDRLAESSDVHLVGVYVESKLGQATGIDIRRYLDNYSVNGLWREINLKDFSEADMEKQKSMLIFGIYREVAEENPLYLKYQVAPWKPIPAKIDISRDPAYDGILVGLRPPRGSDESTPKIVVRLGDDQPAMLATQDFNSDFEIIPRKFSTKNPMTIKLQNRLDVSRAVECDLLVAVPSRALIHAVPVVILPVLGEKPLQVFRWSLIAIGSVAVVLAIVAIGLDQGLHSTIRRFKHNLSIRKRSSPASVDP